MMPATAPATKLSPEERQRLRLEAAEKYMRGDMDVETFEDMERRYRPDYDRIMQALVDSQTRIVHAYAQMAKLAVASLAALVTAILLDHLNKREE